MKYLQEQLKKINKIEFWAATTTFAFVVLFHIIDSVGDNKVKTGFQAPEDYPFLSNLVRYTVLYLSFLVINFSFVPKMIKRESLAKNILLTLLVLGFDAVILGIADFFLPPFLAESKVRESLMFYILQVQIPYMLRLALAFIVYSAIKYLGLRLIKTKEGRQFPYHLTTEYPLAIVLGWLLLLFWLSTARAALELISTATIIIPAAVFYYVLSIRYLLPRSFRKKRPLLNYLVSSISLQAILLIPVVFTGSVITDNMDLAVSIGMLNIFFQLLVVTPLSWTIFKRNMADYEELYQLKKELGQTHANIDFLRTQINPHFLFNALNTIYGTAILEKAPRTSEAVEKLGDMMRFMMRENMLEKILLSRELEYLENFISLQKLRTDLNPMVKIEVTIAYPAEPLQITPMLLIPFVENAFKHGISFRESSPVRIRFTINGDTLNFAVSNNKHREYDNDPEKTKNGIGLNNVKQRLQLSYPDKHKLRIQETEKEFYIDLSIKLQ